MKLSEISCVEDLRVISKRKIPGFLYDYVDSGSWGEITYRENQSEFNKIKFRQRVGVNIENLNLSTVMAGSNVAMPVAIAPTGFAGFLHADGEIHLAKAAEKARIPMGLSIASNCSIEDVREHSSVELWFQVSMIKDLGFLESLLERAKWANCSAIVITMDYHLVGQRNKEVNHGLGIPPRMSFKHWVEVVKHPRWCREMLKTKRRTFGNVVGHAEGVNDVDSFFNWMGGQFELKMNWDMVGWVRKRWSGKIVVKGVMDPEDAVNAMDAGADVVVVSNHGGRQIDGAPSTIAVLPSVVDAVGGQIEVLLDGGVRSGQDVIRARSLGAQGVMVGRATLYGLMSFGESGVSKVLEMLYKEAAYTMGFCGVCDISDVDKTILWKY